MTKKKQGAHSSEPTHPSEQRRQPPPDGAWRDLPPTEAQEAVLRRWARIRGERYPVMPKTRGEAADHITAVVEAAKRRDEADAFDPPNYEDHDIPPARDWGDL